MKTTQEEILLAPSSLSYAWEECQACFYARAVHGERKTPLTMPSIFSKIDSRMKASLTGRELSELVPGAPKGVLGEGGSIKAAPWRAQPQHRPIVLRGYPDTLIHFEGDDGSDQVIVGDYKTVVPSAKTAARYKTQLESYAFALEHPAKGKPVKVAGLGLLCYSPDAFAVVAPSDDSPLTGRLDGSFVWIPVKYDEKRYLAFLGKVAAVLNGPAPAPTDGCLGCELRRLRALENDVQRLEEAKKTPPPTQLELDWANPGAGMNTLPPPPPVTFNTEQAKAVVEHVECVEYDIAEFGRIIGSASWWFSTEPHDGQDFDLDSLETRVESAYRLSRTGNNATAMSRSTTSTGETIRSARSILTELAEMAGSAEAAELVIGSASAQELRKYVLSIEGRRENLAGVITLVAETCDEKVNGSYSYGGAREAWRALQRALGTHNVSMSSPRHALAGVI